MSGSIQKVWKETSNSIVRDSNGDLVYYKCRFCAKQIARQDYFKLHLQRQHYMCLNIEKPPKNNECPYDQCQYSFYTKGELNSHIRNIHTQKTCTATKPAPRPVTVGFTRNNATLSTTLVTAQSSQAIIANNSSPSNEMKKIPSQRIVAITDMTLAPSKAQPTLEPTIVANVKLAKPLGRSFFIISPNISPMISLPVLNSAALSTNSQPLNNRAISTANQIHRPQISVENHTINDMFQPIFVQSTASASSISNEENPSLMEQPSEQQFDQIIEYVGDDNESEVTSSTDDVNDCKPKSIEERKVEESALLDYKEQYGKLNSIFFEKRFSN